MLAILVILVIFYEKCRITDFISYNILQEELIDSKWKLQEILK
jgi:hypothetical protein